MQRYPALSSAFSVSGEKIVRFLKSHVTFKFQYHEV